MATVHVGPSALFPDQSPNKWRAPAIGMFVMSWLALLFGLAGVLGAVRALQFNGGFTDGHGTLLLVAASSPSP